MCQAVCWARDLESRGQSSCSEGENPCSVYHISISNSHPWQHVSVSWRRKCLFWWCCFVFSTDPFFSFQILWWAQVSIFLKAPPMHMDCNEHPGLRVTLCFSARIESFGTGKSYHLLKTCTCGKWTKRRWRSQSWPYEQVSCVGTLRQLNFILWIMGTVGGLKQERHVTRSMFYKALLAA